MNSWLPWSVPLGPMIVVALLLQGCAEAVTWNPGRPTRQGSQAAYNQPQAQAPVAREREPEPIPQRPYGPDDYMVKKGDTLYSIAFRNQVDYREIARLNSIGPDFRILPGQVLRMNANTRTPRAGEIASTSVDLNETERPRAISTQVTPVVRGAAEAPLPTPVAVATPAPTISTPVVDTPAGSGGIAGWRWPVDGTVVRGYNPDNGSRGLDFTGTVGQPVVAASGGKVVYSGSALKGYGELVIIKHDDLHLSAYGYNSKRLVKEGDVVGAGQQIAELGIGPESKPLLHFEVRERGKPVNPVPYLPAR